MRCKGLLAVMLMVACDRSASVAGPPRDGMSDGGPGDGRRRADVAVRLDSTAPRPDTIGFFPSSPHRMTAIRS